MCNFHIKIDDKFDEFIIKIKENKPITINDLISLKSFIIDVYHNDNTTDNNYIKLSLSMIDFKI